MPYSPYPALPYPTLPYPTLPYPTLPCPALLCPTLPCTALPLPNTVLPTSCYPTPLFITLYRFAVPQVKHNKGESSPRTPTTPLTPHTPLHTHSSNGVLSTPSVKSGVSGTSYGSHRRNGGGDRDRDRDEDEEYDREIRSARLPRAVSVGDLREKEKEKDKVKGPVNPYARYASITSSVKSEVVPITRSASDANFNSNGNGNGDAHIGAGTGTGYGRPQVSVSTAHHTPALNSLSPSSPLSQSSPLLTSSDTDSGPSDSIVVIVASSPHIAMVVDSSVSLKPGTELFTAALGPKEKVLPLPPFYSLSYYTLPFFSFFISFLIFTSFPFLSLLLFSSFLFFFFLLISSFLIFFFHSLLLLSYLLFFSLLQGWKPFGSENMAERHRDSQPSRTSKSKDKDKDKGSK